MAKKRKSAKKNPSVLNVLPRGKKIVAKWVKVDKNGKITAGVVVPKR